MVVAVFAGVFLVLFALAYVSKRKFGLLGLALTAGATLSTLWSYEASLLVSGLGFVPNGPVASAISLSAVVLLPPILLLFHGYSYKGKFARVVGSLLFATLALAFLIEPIGYALVLDGQAAEYYKIALEYRSIVISVGVILAVVDLLLTKHAPGLDKRGRHG